MRRRRNKSLVTKSTGLKKVTSDFDIAERIKSSVNNCPLVTKDADYSFDFRFIGRCTMSSCQYNNHETKNGCMMLDVKLPSKDLTDAEIFYYKIRKNPDFSESEKPKPRTVNLLRKKYSSSIKSNIVFFYFVEYVLENYAPEDSEFVYVKGIKLLDIVLNSFPFNQAEVPFSEWQLPFLFDDSVYKKFCSSDSNMLINSADINLNSVLGLTPVKFHKVHKVIKSLLDANEAHTIIQNFT